MCNQRCKGARGASHLRYLPLPGGRQRIRCLLAPGDGRDHVACTWSAYLQTHLQRSVHVGGGEAATTGGLSPPYTWAMQFAATLALVGLLVLVPRVVRVASRVDGTGSRGSPTMTWRAALHQGCSLRASLFWPGMAGRCRLALVSVATQLGRPLSRATSQWASHVGSHLVSRSVGPAGGESIC